MQNILSMLGLGGGSSVTINGITIEGDFNSVEMRNGQVYVDGKPYEGKGGTYEGTTVKVEVHGNVERIEAKGSVTVHGDAGNVNAGGSTEVGGSASNVNAGGSVQAGDVQGSVSAGGSVECRNVGGNIRASGSVKHRV